LRVTTDKLFRALLLSDVPQKEITMKFVNVCCHDIRIEGQLLRVARLELDKYEFLDDPQPLIADLRKCGSRIDLFKFLQKLPDVPDGFTNVSPLYPYPMQWDNLAVLPVSTFDHWWNQQLRSVPRNRARQAARKGVVIREAPFDDALARGIWQIYNESPLRQGKPFAHYGKDSETVRNMSATFPDRSIFLGAYIGDQLIGFIKLVTNAAHTQACMMHIVSMMQHRDKAPTNALVAQAVRSCADRGIRYLVYQNYTYGKKEDDSLTHFKEINGFRRVDLPRYYVPLTPVGRAALGLGLHRRFIDSLPKPVVVKLRELRSAWYSRKLQASEVP
jgi:Acetyltransferase (GNAT) domain